MKIIVGEDLIVRSWLGQKLGDTYREGLTLGVVSNEDRLVGGVLFHCYTGPSVDLGVYGRIGYRSVFRAMAEMVFGHMGCVRVQAVTKRSNEHVRRLLPKFKFKFEGVLRSHYGDEDGLMFSMLRHEAIALGYFKETQHGREGA